MAAGMMMMGVRDPEKTQNTRDYSRVDSYQMGPKHLTCCLIEEAVGVFFCVILCCHEVSCKKNVLIINL